MTSKFLIPVIISITISGTVLCEIDPTTQIEYNTISKKDPSTLTSADCKRMLQIIIGSPELNDLILKDDTFLNGDFIKSKIESGELSSKELEQLKSYLIVERMDLDNSSMGMTAQSLQLTTSAINSSIYPEKDKKSTAWNFAWQLILSWASSGQNPEVIVENMNIPSGYKDFILYYVHKHIVGDIKTWLNKRYASQLEYWERASVRAIKIEATDRKIQTLDAKARNNEERVQRYNQYQLNDKLDQINRNIQGLQQ